MNTPTWMSDMAKEAWDRKRSPEFVALVTAESLVEVTRITAGQDGNSQELEAKVRDQRDTIHALESMLRKQGDRLNWMIEQARKNGRRFNYTEIDQFLAGTKV
jgi:hypothetical protein